MQELIDDVMKAALARLRKEVEMEIFIPERVESLTNVIRTLREEKLEKKMADLEMILTEQPGLQNIFIRIYEILENHTDVLNSITQKP